MIAGIFLVERTSHGVSDDRNRVRQVVVHEDDAQTDAQIIQAEIDTLNANTPTGDSFSSGNPVYPDGYFDTVTQVGATPVANLATDGDLIAFSPSVLEEIGRASCRERVGQYGEI